MIKIQYKEILKLQYAGIWLRAWGIQITGFCTTSKSAIATAIWNHQCCLRFFACHPVKMIRGNGVCLHVSSSNLMRIAVNSPFPGETFCEPTIFPPLLALADSKYLTIAGKWSSLNVRKEGCVIQIQSGPSIPHSTIPQWYKKMEMQMIRCWENITVLRNDGDISTVTCSHKSSFKARPYLLVEVI